MGGWLLSHATELCEKERAGGGLVTLESQREEAAGALSFLGAAQEETTLWLGEGIWCPPGQGPMPSKAVGGEEGSSIAAGEGDQPMAIKSSSGKERGSHSWG